MTSEPTDMTEQTTTAPRTGNDSLQVAETVTDPGAAARDVIAKAICRAWAVWEENANPDDHAEQFWEHYEDEADAVLAALAEQGYVIVAQRDITSARHALIEATCGDGCTCPDCVTYRSLTMRWAPLDPILAARPDGAR